MPAPPNKFKGRQFKEKREKPIRKPAQKIEWSAPKVQSPRSGAGLSWGDAAPTWGDAAPSWGIDDDTPSGNKASSGSVWDDPKLESNPEPAVDAETSEWGTGEWTYPGASATEEGNPAGESWSHDNPATDSRNHPNSGTTAWGDGGWVGLAEDSADPSGASGWNDSYNTQEYSEQDYQQNNDGFGNSGGWGVLTYEEVPASWGDEVLEHNDQETGNYSTGQAPFSSSFQLNPTASVFIPRDFVPPTTVVQVEPEADQLVLTVSEPTEASTHTTPSTATNSFPLNSAFDSETFSTPATRLTDAGAEAADVTEQLRQVDLEVAEYKLGVSEADLEMKKASLEVMRAKLEVMEKKRAMLVAARKRPVK